jgi:hypothetical protein
MTTIIQTRADTSPARDSRGGDAALHGASTTPRDAAPPRRVRSRGRPRRYDYDAILDLWADGKEASEICAVLGIPHRQAVEIIIARAREYGDPRAIPHKRGPKPSPLTAEARMRSMSPYALRNALIRTIVADNLFDAVLGKPGEPA